MDSSFEQRLKAEIAKLRDVAVRALAQADDLQRVLDKWSSAEPEASAQSPASQPKMNGTSGHPVSRLKPGAKIGHFLQSVRATGAEGLPRQRMYAMMAEHFGMTQGSCRAMLRDAIQTHGIVLKGDRIFFEGIG